MADRGERLTATECRAIKPGEYLFDGDGLMLIAREDGARWRLRFTSPETGKRRDIGLGPFPSLTLAKARARAEELRAVVRAGRDPIEDRDRAAEQARQATAKAVAVARRNAATVESLCRQYHANISPGFRNRKHAAQWIATLETYVFPTLGATPVAAVTPDALLAILLPLRDRVPETAKRVRERVAAVFDDAALHGLCDRNPADLIRRPMRRRNVTPSHLRALAFAAVPAFVAALRAFERTEPVAKLALEFAILTAARSGEVRGARWSEIDKAGKVWTVPAERMKGGTEHRVPLSPRALAILESAGEWTAGKPSDLIFPGRDRGRPLSDMTLTQILRRMPTGLTREDGEPQTFADVATVHGFRSAFSTWGRERTRFRVDVIEAALAHREQDRVAAAYSRAEYWKERVALATGWAQFIESPQGTGKVVRFDPKRAIA